MGSELECSLCDLIDKIYDYNAYDNTKDKIARIASQRAFLFWHKDFSARELQKPNTSCTLRKYLYSVSHKCTV